MRWAKLLWCIGRCFHHYHYKDLSKLSSFTVHLQSTLVVSLVGPNKIFENWNQSDFGWLQFQQHWKTCQHNTVVSTTTTHACLHPSRLASGDYYKHGGKAPKWWGCFNTAETMVGKVRGQSPHRWESHNKSYSKLHHASVHLHFVTSLSFIEKLFIATWLPKTKKKKISPVLRLSMFAFLNLPLHSGKF